MAAQTPEDGSWSWVHGLTGDLIDGPRDCASLRGCAADAAEITSRWGRGPLEWAVRLGDTVTATILRTVPEFVHPGVAEAMRDGVRSGALRLLLDIADGGRRGLWTPEAVAADRCFFANGLDLATVRHGVRAGVVDFTQAFVGAVAQLVPPARRTEETCRVVAVVLGSFEVFTAQIEQRFELERELVVQTRAAKLRRAVSALLTGSPISESAVDAFDYPLNAKHLAVVVWAADSVSSADPLRRGAADLVGAAGGRASLQLAQTDGRLWLWIADPTRLDDVLALDLPAATGAACGRVATGHDGFRSTHRQAEAAARLTRHSAPGRVTSYADLALLDLLTQGNSAAGEFIRDELGPLAEDTEDMRALRQTVSCYLAEHRSLQRAAARLYVNRNTIAYRIRKAERLLGRSLDGRRLELESALLMTAHLAGDEAASPASGTRSGLPSQ